MDQNQNWQHRSFLDDREQNNQGHNPESDKNTGEGPERPESQGPNQGSQESGPQGPWNQQQGPGSQGPWNQQQGPGPSGPNAYGPNPYGRPMPGNLYRPRKTKTAIFPVLLSILLTFVITAGSVWALSSQGILPGTGRGSGNSSMDPGQVTDTGSLGLSIHTADPEAKIQAEKLAQMIETLQNNYYKVLSPSEIIEAMGIGLANSMDSKYTYYLSREDVQAFMESLEGNYSGIGATVSQDQETKLYSIVSVVAKGPAEKAGLQAGDVIFAIDGQAAEQFANVQELANRVRGEKGSKVRMTIIRDGKQVDVTLTRAQVEVEFIHTRMLNDSVGYMQITEFSNNLIEPFKKGLDELLKAGAKDIVFDLRNNPGGSAESVVKVLDQLLPEELLVTIKGRENGKPYTRTWESGPDRMVPDDMRYAILVNGNSASASELFSGVLRDHGKAVLVGEKTYGKGSGTSLYTMDDGSGINVTIFNYYLPSGELIEGKGLLPDIPAEAVDPKHQATPLYKLEPKDDDALTKAIKSLESYRKDAGGDHNL